MALRRSMAAIAVTVAVAVVLALRTVSLSDLGRNVAPPALRPARRSTQPAALAGAASADTSGRSAPPASTLAHGAECPVVGEWVHIALISHGWGAARAKAYYTNTSIKGPNRSMALVLQGLLRTARCPLHLHFVSGPPEERWVRRYLAPLRRWRHRLRLSFVPLDTAQVDRWMAAIGHTASHRTGHAGNVKFFYSELFPATADVAAPAAPWGTMMNSTTNSRVVQLRVPRVLMLDTDVLVASDVCQLWRHFAHFAPGQLFSLAPQWSGRAVARGVDNVFNAGVGLLDLGRMHRAGWVGLARDAIRAWDAAGKKPRCCAHGDQSAYHMVWWHHEAAIARHVPRWWNINKCHGYQGLKARLATVRPLNLSSSRRCPVAGKTKPVGGRSDVAALPFTAAEEREEQRPFLGFVHLGCCKLCSPQHLPAPLRALVAEIDAFSLVVAFGAPCRGDGPCGAVEEVRWAL